MAFDYTAAQQTALRLLQNFGASGQCIRFIKTLDPVAGSNVVDDALINEHTVAVVPIGKAGLSKSIEQHLQQELIAGKVRKVLLSATALTFSPDVNDVIYANGEYLRIKGFQPLNPAGVNVLFTAIATVTELADNEDEFLNGEPSEPGAQITLFNGEPLTDFSGNPFTLFV